MKMESLKSRTRCPLFWCTPCSCMVCTCSQRMIDTKFGPFAFKTATERHNCLLLNSNGLAPNAVLHGISLDTIPVKTCHRLCCPVYILDAHSQCAGSPGPPKWEPISCMEFILGTLLFMLAVLLWCSIRALVKNFCSAT